MYVLKLVLIRQTCILGVVYEYECKDTQRLKNYILL